MSTVLSRAADLDPTWSDALQGARAEALARRLEEGARRLLDLAETLTDAEWRTPIPGDGRTIGVVIHHVATVYPVEISLALTLASGQPIAGVRMDTVHDMNAAHAREHATVGRAETVDLLRANSEAAAHAIRTLTDQQLDSAAPASLYANAPVTCQFVIEDHAMRHSYHHLLRIRETLGR
jgi:hypothetical protein